MRREPKLTPDSNETPCCPETGTPEAFIKSKHRLPSSTSTDSYGHSDFHGVSQDDEFLTTLSADTPESGMNEILGSVFGDSSPSSLGLLTPVDPTEDGSPEPSLLPVTSKMSSMSEPAIANPILQHITSHGAHETDLFPTDTYMGLGDEISPDHFVDFTTTAASIPHFEAMMPPSQMPDLNIANGFGSPSTSAMWADPDVQMPQPGQNERMTIIIDKARPETLTQVMNVLIDSRARVEFRRG